MIASHYRQLSADIEMKIYKIKTSLANKTGSNIMIFILVKFVESGSNIVGTINNFSVWLRTGSNLVDIIRFRSNTGKSFNYQVRQAFAKLIVFCAHFSLPDGPTPPPRWLQNIPEVTFNSLYQQRN